MSRVISSERFAERAKGKVERVIEQLRPLATSLDVDADLDPLIEREDGDAPETFPSGM